MQERTPIPENISERLLLIEGNRIDATKVIDALTEHGAPQVEWVMSLSEGLQHLQRPGVVAVLLDLFLPDCEGIDTYEATKTAAGHSPILVLCAASDEQVARLTVEHGADDFLLKDHLDNYSLTRAVRSMLERCSKDDALFVEKERAEITLNSIGDAVLSTDVAGRVTYMNTVAEAMTGWSRAEAEGRPLAEAFNIIDGTTRKPSPNPLAAAVRENKTVSLNGELHPDQAGRI